MAQQPATTETKDEVAAHLTKIEEVLDGWESIHLRYHLRNDPAKYASQVLAIFRTKPVAKPADDKNTAATAEYQADQKRREQALDLLKSVKAKDLVAFKEALVEIQKQYQGTAIGDRANELVLSASLAKSGIKGDLAIPVIKDIPTYEQTKAMKEALADARKYRDSCPAQPKLALWTQQLSVERAALEKQAAEKLVETRRLDRTIPRLKVEITALQEKQREAIRNLGEVAHTEKKIKERLLPVLKDIFVMKPYTFRGVTEGKRIVVTETLFSAEQSDKVTDHFFGVFASRLIDGSYKGAMPKGATTFEGLGLVKTRTDGTADFFNKADAPEDYTWVTPAGQEALAAFYENLAEVKPHDTALMVKLAPARLKEIDAVVDLLEKEGVHPRYLRKAEIERELSAKNEELKKEEAAREVIAATIDRPLAEIDRVFALVETCTTSAADREKTIKALGVAPTAEAMKQAAAVSKTAATDGTKAAEAVKERNKR